MLSTAWVELPVRQTPAVSSSLVTHAADAHCSRSPRFNLLSGIVKRDKYIGGQTLLAEPPIETLNHRIFHRLSRSDNNQLHLVRIDPGIQRLQGKLAPIVHGDDLRVAALHCTRLRVATTFFPVRVNSSSII